MTAAARKVIADLWLRGHRARTVLLVLAITVGLAGFGAVLSAYTILDREVAATHRATNPAAATLWVDAVDDDLLAAVAACDGVADVEARRAVTGRIRVGPIEWRPLQLFAAKDYASVRISRFWRQEGAWPPAMGEILIERDALQVARARIGGSVTVKIGASDEQTLQVAGTVHDPGQAQARMENIVYGYVTAETLVLLGQREAFDQLKLAVAGDGETRVRAVLDRVSTVLADKGHPVQRTEVGKEHPHAELMGLLLLIQVSFGAAVLLITGLVVVQLLTLQMATQVRQVGVMQAIGGTRWQVARLYLAQAMLVGLLASCIAWPAGRLGGRALTAAMATYLNIDVTSFSVPWSLVLLAAAVGLGLAVLAAAYPVWQGTRMPVCAAIADHGAAVPRFGTYAVDRLVARAGGRIARPFLLSIRNTARRRARLLLTVGTLAAAGLCFTAALSLRASMIGGLDRLFATRNFDLTVGLGAMQPLAKLERAAKATAGVVALEGWITTQAAFVAPGAAEPGSTGGALHGLGRLAGHGHGGGGHGAAAGAGERFPVFALPAATKLQAMDIVEGRGLLPDDVDVMVVNSRLAARTPRIAAGDELTLQMGPAHKSWKVVGIAREPFSPALAYVPLAYFERAGHVGMANNLRLALEKKDAASVAAVTAELERRLADEGVRGQNARGTGDGRFAFDQHFVMIYDFLLVLAGIVLGIGGVGLAATMTLNVLERRREIAVLRALGATPRAVWLIVVGEGCAVAVLAWALAAALAWPAGKVAVGELVGRVFATDVAFVFAWSGPVLWLAISVAVGALASLAPARRATRMSVREALAQG